LALDEGFMREGLALAEWVLGLTSPNPAVGCVIVRDGKVIARAATGPGGRPHAEAEALRMAGARARGATVYVTFEPCAHFGQTPPCAAALVEAGVKRAVIGCIDPYPPVHGRGAAILKRAGVRVTVGVCEPECKRLNEGFITRVKRGRPFATLKLAESLDGRIATSLRDSRWISSPASRELVHRWRRESDAVMVGAATVTADNPRLTCRIEDGRDPARVVVDAHLGCPVDARIFRERSAAPAILVTTAENAARAERLYGRARVEIIGAPARGGEIALDEVAREFGRRGWCRVLIEGGAHLAASALRAGVVDRVAFFVTPQIIGCGLPAVEGLAVARVREAVRLENLSARPIGEDWLLEATVCVRNRRG
jgi:diaminohydroxyphosphoribosylaminopyrimidine deaminase / 5-amino-6-(5-phosphoribosylamino)uracil reductase